MIFSDKIYARIDRPDQVVKFGKTSSSSNKLELWIQNVNKIVELVDLVSEKVQRRIAVE